MLRESSGIAPEYVTRVLAAAMPDCGRQALVSERRAEDPGEVFPLIYGSKADAPASLPLAYCFRRASELTL